MNKVILTLLSTIIFVSVAFGQLRIDHERFQEMLQDGQHQEMAKEVRSLIKKKQYAKNWKLYVYIALASCKEGQSERGRKLFELIKDKLDLNQAQINVVNQYQNACQIQSNSYDINLNSFLSNIFLAMNSQPEGSSAGKFGYVVDCSKMTSTFSIDDNFDQSGYQNRLFEINEKSKAVSYYKNLLPSRDYNVNASGRFVIITPSSKNIDQELVDEASQDLEEVYRYYHTAFNVSAPDKLIAVYFMEDKKKLQKAALKTHGLTLPDDNIGYSNLSDLSVLGNSRKDRFGTIKHELFHLMIRTDIGDIPAWLDEGIASYFAESHWEGDKLVTDDYSWRTKTLRDANKRFGSIPTLYELFMNGWNMFKHNVGMSVCELSVNYALAEHFVYFLEDQGKLFDLVELFKQRRTPFINEHYEYEEDITIVEMVFDKPLFFIQNDFNEWMRRNYGIVTFYSKEQINWLAQELFNRLENTNTCDRRELKRVKYEYERIFEDFSELEPIEEYYERHGLLRYYPELIHYYNSPGDYYNYRFLYECIDDLPKDILPEQYSRLRNACERLREYNYRRSRLLAWLQNEYERGFGCRRFRIR